MPQIHTVPLPSSVSCIYVPISFVLNAISQGPKNSQFSRVQLPPTCPRNECCPNQNDYTRGRINHRCINSYLMCHHRLITWGAWPSILKGHWCWGEWDSPEGCSSFYLHSSPSACHKSSFRSVKISVHTEEKEFKREVIVPPVLGEGRGSLYREVLSPQAIFSILCTGDQHYIPYKLLLIS